MEELKKCCKKDTIATIVDISKSKELTCKSHIGEDFLILGLWILIPICFQLFAKFVKITPTDRARIFVSYFILSLLIVLILVGEDFISELYYANIVTEVVGIALTVLIIERVNNYLTDRNEKINRDISLRYCKFPVFSYCYMWFAIYEPNQHKRQAKLDKYNTLEDFYMSDDFHNSVCAFNFSNPISSNKNYAQYYLGTINRTQENFQNILAKYASKLAIEDIKQLEFFGGGAYI